MKDSLPSEELAEHFFRNEYGRLVSFLTRYLGMENLHVVEDIVQDALLKAVSMWQNNQIPDNPPAWLTTTAKNLAINYLKKEQHDIRYRAQLEERIEKFTEVEVNDYHFEDEQLQMMFVCSHAALPEQAKISLILKTLCGFSISEIANAFGTSNDTINKRLVRARQQLRTSGVGLSLDQGFEKDLPTVLQVIYLLFNEGYSPSYQNQVIRYDCCLEAIRLCEMLRKHPLILQKTDCDTLLALMYLNVSRFQARVGTDDQIIDMEHQDRTKWNQTLINQGIQYLERILDQEVLSKYAILAMISAQHCIAPSYKDTNWKKIETMYQILLEIEDTPHIHLNKAIASAKVIGITAVLPELLKFENNDEMTKSYLYHMTLAAFYSEIQQYDKSILSYKKALQLADNLRDKKNIENKIQQLVPKIYS